jgi:hypothetical protein
LNTVRSNSNWWFWNTTPICRRRNGICALLMVLRSCPASSSLPLVGRSMASNRRNRCFTGAGVAGDKQELAATHSKAQLMQADVTVG